MFGRLRTRRTDEWRPTKRTHTSQGMRRTKTGTSCPLGNIDIISHLCSRSYEPSRKSVSIMSSDKESSPKKLSEEISDAPAPPTDPMETGGRPEDERGPDSVSLTLKTLLSESGEKVSYIPFFGSVTKKGFRSQRRVRLKRRLSLKRTHSHPLCPPPSPWTQKRNQQSRIIPR